MVITRTVLGVGVLVLVLSSCLYIPSGPALKIVYEPPVSEAGKECALQCFYKKNDCYRNCNEQARNCRIREIYVDNMSKYMSEKTEAKKPSCEDKKKACRSGCKGGDMACSMRCNMICDSMFPDLEDIYAKPAKKQSICTPNKCEAFCKSDYDACFIGCGGRKYVKELAAPKS